MNSEERMLFDETARAQGECEECARLREINADLLKVCHAALHALRSYQYGNTATALAEGVADEIEAAITKARS